MIGVAAISRETAAPAARKLLSRAEGVRESSFDPPTPATARRLSRSAALDNTVEEKDSTW
jgi:hypothetical protein